VCPARRRANAEFKSAVARAKSAVENARLLLEGL
jgi:hypothetical protein